MKSDYVLYPAECDPRIAIASLDNAFGVWTIRRINVPEKARGLGHGTELLKLVLMDADDEGEALRLAVYSSGPLDNEALEAWYGRHGFTWVEDEYGPLLERQPKGKK